MTYVTNAERIGKELGRQEGHLEGLQEGAAEKATTIARNMLQKGMDRATIAELTELSIDQVQQLQATLKPD